MISIWFFYKYFFSLPVELPTYISFCSASGGSMDILYFVSALVEELACPKTDNVVSFLNQTINCTVSSEMVTMSAPWDKCIISNMRIKDCIIIVIAWDVLLDHVS